MVLNRKINKHKFVSGIRKNISWDILFWKEKKNKRLNEKVWIIKELKNIINSSILISFWGGKTTNNYNHYIINALNYLINYFIITIYPF